MQIDWHAGGDARISLASPWTPLRKVSFTPCRHAYMQIESAAAGGEVGAPATPLRAFAGELRELSRLQHTFGEVEDVRRLVTAFTKVATSEAAASAAASAASASAAAATTAAAGSGSAAAAAATAAAGGTAGAGSGTSASAPSSRGFATAASTPSSRGFATAASAPASGDFATAARLLSGLLFQEGSRPLHRALLGGVQRLAPGQQGG